MAQVPRELTPDASARHAFGAELRRLRTSQGLSQDELGRLVLHSGDMISKVEKATRWPTGELVVRCDEVLDAAGALLRLWPAVLEEQTSLRTSGSSEFGGSGAPTSRRRVMVRASLDLGDPPDEAVYRRQLLGSGLAAIGGLALSDAAASALGRLAADLTAYGSPSLAEVANATLRRATRAVSRAKVLYQAVRYDDVVRLLPDLLDLLGQVKPTGDADVSTVDVLRADAYQVAGSVLLKLNDPTLAALAADRSMRAAQRSGDPRAVGSSARILTHTVLSAGHADRAQRLAEEAADRLLADATPSPETFAVYGALVLRGAVAAAHASRPGEAESLLDVAQHAARHVGDGVNLRWTGFDATNVSLHRVNVALTLAEPGRALAVAGRIDQGKVTLAERKASLHIDIAHANALCQRWEAAMESLRLVEQVAPQELRTRTGAKRLVTQVATVAPRSVRTDALALARRMGVSL